MLETAEAQAMQVLVLLALALFLISQLGRVGPVWRRRGLILGALCLGAAVVFTVIAWYT